MNKVILITHRMEIIPALRSTHWQLTEDLSRMAGRRLISSPVRYSEKERSLPRNISTKEPRLQLQADLKLVPIRIRTA